MIFIHDIDLPSTRSLVQGSVLIEENDNYICTLYHRPYRNECFKVLCEISKCLYIIKLFE